jgi:iron complex outermembrane receptor protein
LETSGVEVELTWLPAVDGLLVGFNVGYLDSDVKEFLEETEGGTVDISDDTAMGFAPEWTVQARVNYDFDIGSAGSLMVGTDVSYRTDSYTALTVDTSSPSADAQVQEEHAIWNAIAAWRSPNLNWRVALEGKNLTDERVKVNSFSIGPIVTTGWNLPRTWAVTVGYEF